MLCLFLTLLPLRVGPLPVQELTALFGPEWATENLIPPILEIREHQSYLRRLTALKACAMMATASDADTARIDLLPIILDMATDVVSTHAVV
jgi:serine/threonine-protein phosphatase 2A regulatory subunit A